MGASRAKGRAQLIAYQAKVTLLFCGRPIWRRFTLYPAITLEQLHSLLQVVMGWEDCHEYFFQYTPLDARGRKRRWRAIGSEDESTTVVGDVLQHPGDPLMYVYDLGDHWEHRIDLERIIAAPEDLVCPVALAGARACPPEEIGGPPGYERMIKAIKGHKDPADHFFDGFADGEFDPEAFDIAAINRELNPPARRRATSSSGSRR